MQKNMRFILSALLVAVGLPAQAAYPEKPIKIVVPYVVGSPADALSRLVADGLRKSLNQPVMVENKPGANAMIGSSTLAKAPADGYTIGLGTMDTHAINPLIYRKISYDAVKDFTPIVNVSGFNMVLVGRPKLPAANGTEVLALARKSPESVSYGTWGLGSLAHLWGLQLEKAGAVKLFHVPFQGSPAAQQSLMGDQIDMMFMLPNAAVNSQQAGHVKILGSTSADRLTDYPQILTLAEQGFTGFAGSQWFGLFAPANTPESVIETLNKEVNAILEKPETMEKLSVLSMYAIGGSPSSFVETIDSSTKVWKHLIAESDFQPLD